MPLLILFAFLGGVVTILSPCILPILPIVLSGSVTTGKRKPVGIVAGFVASFTFFTLFLTSIVRATGISPDILRNVSVVILVFFGLTLFIPQIQAGFERLVSKLATKSQVKQNRDGFGGGFLVGLSLGLIWTPCVGPILASVISLALTGTVTGSAFIITLAYALGTAIPMFIIMYGGRALLNKVPWFLNNSDKIQKVFGVVMILVALAIFFNIDRSFQAYVLEKFPNYGTGLTVFEDNKSVIQELKNLNKKDDNAQVALPDVSLDKGYPAPELILGGEWLNSEPMKLSKLKGQVVLLDIMTYSCINCIRTFPYLNAWYEKYKDDGLVIIGIHTPEFEFEKNPDNVQKALDDFGIKFPVMQDNNYATWNAYNNHYWPRKYLIDYKGNVVYDHIGEGKYDETEGVIQKLLMERSQVMGENFDEFEISNPAGTDISEAKSPEVYFGAWRNEYLGNGNKGIVGEQEFKQPEIFLLNTLYLAGNWDIKREYASNLSESARIIFPYYAKKVFIVAGSQKSVKVQVLQDGKLINTVEIQEQKLYELLENDISEKHTLELIIENPGLEAFTFTFG